MQELTTNQIVDALIEQRMRLFEEIKGYFKELNRIDAAIKILRPEHNLPTLQEEVDKVMSNPEAKQNNQNVLFPNDDVVVSKASFENQILAKFREIGKFSTLASFIDLFSSDSKTSKSKDEIKGKIRRMKRKGELVSVKFNGNYRYSYWGLSQWVKAQEDSIVILREHFPASDDMTEESTYELIE